MRIDDIKVSIDYVKLLDILRTDSKIVLHKFRMWIAWFIFIIAGGNIMLYTLLPPELAIMFVIAWVLLCVASVCIFIYTTKDIPRYLRYLPFQKMMASMEYVTEEHNDATFKVLDEMPYVDILFDSWECLRVIEQGINDMIFDVAHFTLNITDTAGLVHKFNVSEFYTEDTVDTWLQHAYMLVITLDNLYVVDTRLSNNNNPYRITYAEDQIQW